MRMHLEGVKNPQNRSRKQEQDSFFLLLLPAPVVRFLPVAAPAAIVIPISIAMTSATTNIVKIAVAVATIAPEDIRETGIAIRSPAVPTAITRVVTVNKLRTFLAKVRRSAPASLAHGIGRHPDDHQ